MMLPILTAFTAGLMLAAWGADVPVSPIAFTYGAVVLLYSCLFDATPKGQLHRMELCDRSRIKGKKLHFEHAKLGPLFGPAVPFAECGELYGPEYPLSCRLRDFLVTTNQAA